MEYSLFQCSVQYHRYFTQWHRFRPVKCNHCRTGSYGHSKGPINDCAVPFAPATCFSNTATLTRVRFMSANEIFTRRSTTATTTSTPLPIAPGSASGCSMYTRYMSVKSAEMEAEINTCWAKAAFYEVAMSDFLQWNPSLANSTPCQLEKGYRYCARPSECTQHSLLLRSQKFP